MIRPGGALRPLVQAARRAAKHTGHAKGSRPAKRAHSAPELPSRKQLRAEDRALAAFRAAAYAEWAATHPGWTPPDAAK